jgi:hypothetical protein
MRVRWDPRFYPEGKPRFVSAIAAEDRCHLNGLGRIGGQSAYVTALSETDTEGGLAAGQGRG